MATISLGKAGVRSLALQINQVLAPQGVYVGTLTVSGLISPDSPTRPPNFSRKILGTTHQLRCIRTGLLTPCIMNPIASTGQAIELIRLTVGPAQQPDFLTDRPNVDAFISTLPGFVSTVPIERRSPTSRPKSVINVSAAAKWLGSKNTLLFVLPTKPGCQYRSNLTLSDLQESPLQDYLAIQ